MDVREAFEELGLPETASETEIKERYLALAKERHPDRKDTDEATAANKAMATLNSARDIALAIHSDETAVVVRGIFDLMSRGLRDQQTMSDAQETYARIKTSVTDRVISPYQRQRLMAGASCGIAAVAALLSTQLSSTDWSTMFSIAFGIVAAGALLFALIINQQVEYQKSLVEAFGNELDRKDVLANLLIESQVGVEFSEDDLVVTIERGALEGRQGDRGSIGETIRRIRPRDSARMIIARALAHGLVEERSTVEFESFKSLFVMTSISTPSLQLLAYSVDCGLGL